MVKKQKTTKTKNKEKKILKINATNNYYYNSNNNQVVNPESITEDMEIKKIKELLENLKEDRKKMEKEYYKFLVEHQSKENKKFEKYTEQIKKIYDKDKKNTEKTEEKPKKNVIVTEKKKNEETITIRDVSISEPEKNSSPSITLSVKSDRDESSSSPPSSIDTKEAKKNASFYNIFSKTFEKYENFEKYKKYFDKETNKEPIVFRPDALRIQNEIEEAIKKLENKKKDKGIKEPRECPHCHVKRNRKAMNEHIYLEHKGRGLKQSVLETMYKRVSKKRYKRIKEILEDLEEQAKICGVKDTRLDEMLKIINK